MITDPVFQFCLRLILQLEGGYSNHPDDRGGATYRGILEREYNDWRRKWGFSEWRDVREMNDHECQLIYHDGYWVPSECGGLPYPVSLCVFDGAVNSGVKTGTMTLQRAISKWKPGPVDGHIGPKTLKALDAAVAEIGATGVSEQYALKRKLYYRAIVKNNPSQKTFLNGWTNRLLRLAWMAQGRTA